MNIIRVRTAQVSALALLFVLLAAVDLTGCDKRRTRHKRHSRATVDAALPSAGRSSSDPDVIIVRLETLPPLQPLIGNVDVWSQRVFLHNVFEPLVRRGAAGRTELVLAEALQWLSAGRVLRLTVRQGVRFHDGTPLGLADVRAALDRVLGPGSVNETLKAELADVYEVVTLPPRTIELRLTRPNYLVPATLGEIPILPRHVQLRRPAKPGPAPDRKPGAATTPNAASEKRRGEKTPPPAAVMIGTGPFRVAQSRHQQTLVLERFTGYWGPPAGVSEVVFKAIGSASQALAALKNGEVDVLPDLFAGYYPREVERARRRLRVYRLHPHRPRVLLYNFRRRVFRDRRLRMALEHACNREELGRLHRGALAQPVGVPIWPLSSWYDRSLHPRTFNRESAGRLLDAAAPGDARSRLRLKLLYARGTPAVDLVPKLRANLAAVGILLQPEVADFGYLKTMLRRGRFELALVGLALRPEADLSSLLHSRGSSNYGAYSNVVIDAMLEALKGIPPERDRDHAARRLHRALQEDPPLLGLFSPIEILLASDRLGGLPEDGTWPLLARIRWRAAR